MSLSSLTATLFAVFAFIYPLTSQAATLQTDGSGQLLGANNVDIGGVLYDVSFLDGSCAALFNGCDEVGDFTFTTEATALAATDALQVQVFAAGTDFDVMPSLTNGCEGFSCGIFTPFAPSTTSALQARGVNFLNFPGGGGFTLTTEFLITENLPLRVLADWELGKTTVIPLPATGWLILSGLIGLFFAKRVGVNAA